MPVTAAAYYYRDPWPASLSLPGGLSLVTSTSHESVARSPGRDMPVIGPGVTSDPPD